MAMKLINMIFLTITLFIVITFSVLNSNTITVSYLFGTSKIPLSVFTICVLSGGILFGIISVSFSYLRMKLGYKKLQNKYSRLEKELNKLQIKEQTESVDN